MICLSDDVFQQECLGLKFTSFAFIFGFTTFYVLVELSKMSQKPQKNSSSENTFEEYKALCNFIKNYSEEKDFYEKANILHLYTHDCMLQHDQELESEAFCEILSQVPKLCENFLTVKYTLSPQEDFSNDLDKIIRNLQGASLYFEAMQKSLETINLISAIFPAKISLSLLLLGVAHCQNSEEIYGNLLEQFTDQLGMFFKKIESLQMILVEKINQLSAIKHFDDAASITSLMFEMGKLCQVMSELNTNEELELWNVYIKFLSNHKHLLQNLDVNPVLSCLVSKNLDYFQLIKYNFQKETEENEETTAAFSFYLETFQKILPFFTGDFGGRFEKHFLQFTLFLTELFEFLTWCYSLVENCLSITKNILKKNSYFILSMMFKIDEFMKLFIIYEPEKRIQTAKTKQYKSGSFLSHICCLQFMKDCLVHQKEQIFLNILLCLSANKAENSINLLSIKIPCFAVTSNSSEELMDLYQFSYEELTNFLKNLPDSSIQKLNHKVLSGSSACSDIDFLLISDVWLYRLRLSNTSFLKDLCRSTLQNYSADKKLEELLKRMLKFLPIPEKERLLEEFGSLHFLCDNESIEHRHGIPEFLSKEYEFPKVNDKKLMEMVSKLDMLDIYDNLQLVEKACLSVELCTLLLNDSICSEILKFLELTNNMFESEVFEVQVTVLTFIKALSQKHLPEHSNEFEKIVTIMAQLFSSAIHSRNYIVSFEALSTFSFFAKCTPHVKIVQETVKRDPSLKALIKSHISATPNTGFLSENEKNQYLKKCMSEKFQGKFETSEASRQILRNFFSTQLAFT